MQAEPYATGTDANAIQITRSGVAAALVSIPNRYMHTPVEIVSLKDLDNTSKLLAETSEKDRQSRTRNRCNSEGYESVAWSRSGTVKRYLG